MYSGVPIAMFDYRRVFEMVNIVRSPRRKTNGMLSLIFLGMVTTCVDVHAT